MTKGIAYCWSHLVSRRSNGRGIQSHTAYPEGTHSLCRVTCRKDSIRKPPSPTNRLSFIHHDRFRKEGRFSASPNVNDEVEAREGSSYCSARGTPGLLDVGDEGCDPDGTKRPHSRRTNPQRKQTRTDVLTGRSGATRQSDHVVRLAHTRWQLTKSECGVI
jgi:hypothetical protein